MLTKLKLLKKIKDLANYFSNKTYDVNERIAKCITNDDVVTCEICKCLIRKNLAITIKGGATMRSHLSNVEWITKYIHISYYCLKCNPPKKEETNE